MPLSLGPNSATLGLVFAYDTGDTVNSYIGEPTVNLLYSPGAINLTNGAGDIYGRCTKTDLGNGKYRFVNNGTGVSTVRVYTNQSDLINGATYGCSVYFEELVGGISIDWCDTGITGINSSTSPSGRLAGYGTRATYDGPYYFLDINFDSGGAVTLYNPQVERKDHVTQFVAGTRSVTQGLLPLTGSSINLTDVSFNSNAQMVFDGTNDKILLDPVLSAGAGQYTIEAVFKASSIKTQVVWEQNSSTVVQNERACMILLDSGYGGFNGQANDYHSIIPYTTGVWYHWVIVINKAGGGNAVKLYNNGTLYSEGNPSNGGQNLNVGNYASAVGYKLNAASEYFDGQIPVVRIYNRALNATEIQENYKGYKTRFNLT